MGQAVAVMWWSVFRVEGGQPILLRLCPDSRMICLGEARVVKASDPPDNNDDIFGFLPPEIRRRK